MTDMSRPGLRSGRIEPVVPHMEGGGGQCWHAAVLSRLARDRTNYQGGVYDQRNY